MLKYFEKVALQKQKIRKYRSSAGRKGGGEDGSALGLLVLSISGGVTMYSYPVHE